MSDLEQLGAAMFRPDASLLQEGWEYRFVASGQRLQEAQELYSELGFDVRSESIPPEAFPEGCEECQLILMLKFKAIYTRRVL
jgi:hypothetical protein